jgi:hypothetical protein
MSDNDDLELQDQQASTEKVAKQKKPDLREFCRLLNAAADQNGSRSRSRRVAAVRDLLNKGFELKEGEALQPDQAHAVFAAISEFDALDDLALSFVAKPPSTRQPLATAIRNKLRDQMPAAVDYPRTMGADRLFEITQWLRAAARAVVGTDGKPCTDEWVKRAFIVLSNEPESIRCNAVHELIRIVAVHRESPKLQAEEASLRYLAWIANRLAAGKAAELVANRVLSHPVWLEQATLRDARKQSDDARLDYQLRCEAATQEAKVLQASLEQAQSQIREMEDTRVTLERDLKTAIASADQREKHVEHEWQQRLAAQRHGVAKRVLHDLEEAALCLDRPEPNTAMALARVREAEKTIRNQG